MIEFDNLYRLTSDGELLFDDVFLNLNDFDVKKLTDPQYATALNGTGKLSVDPNSNSYSVAKDISKSLGGEASYFNFQAEDNLWKWLTLALFDLVIKKDSSGNKVLDKNGMYGSKFRFYPAPLNDYLVSSRHLIRNPVYLFSVLGKDSKPFLNNKLHTPGEIREQFSQSPYFIQKAFARLFGRFYWNGKSLKAKHANQKAGDVRDLVRVLKQLMVTTALENLDEDKIIEALPSYFRERWLS